MTILFRLVLLLSSVGTLVFVIWRVRRAKIQIASTVFWIAFALVLVVISAFPDIVGYIAVFLNIDSTANFLFLCVLFVMIIRLFFMSLQVSKLQHEVQKLAQELALKDVEKDCQK